MSVMQLARFFVIPGTLISALHAPLLGAQQPAPSQLGVSAGQRVRVQAPTLFNSLRKGKVGPAAGDTLFLIGKNSTEAIPAAAITRLEVSRGRNRWLWGFAGATTGFFVGGTLGARTGDPGYENIGAVLGAFAGAMAGTISGAIIGAVAAPERWRRVYPE